MTTDSKPIKACTPKFGQLSIAAPFIGAISAALLFGVFFQSAPIAIFAFLLIPLSPICGVVFAVMAWKRREPYWALPVIGLLINFAAIFGLCYFAFLVFTGKIDLFKGTSFG
jgi:hypothetical protein